MSILDVAGVSKSFGGVKANVDISMAVEQGSIVGLIGPNGSGKTTLFNSIVGTYPIDKGSIKFDGTEVSELPVPVVAKLGLLRTFQQTRIYGKLNCIENMLISNKPSNDGILSVFQKIPSELTDKAETLLKFVGLHQKRKLRAGDLSFGQQKLLELAKRSCPSGWLLSISIVSYRTPARMPKPLFQTKSVITANPKFVYSPM